MINECGGDGLECDLSRLDLAPDADPLPPSPGPHRRRYQPCSPLSGPDDILSTTENRPYRNLVGTKRTTTRESASPRGIGIFRRDVVDGPSPELVAAIFNGIAKQTGSGRTYARLVMDDSGRWRVARSANPDKMLPGDDDR